MTLTTATTDAGQTRALGAALAAVAEPGDVVLLAGDLGTGKTAFAQGFAAGLGIDEPVTSPTFTLVRSYTGRLTMHHVDVYRLERLQEALDLDLATMIDDGGVTVIEWGDVVAPALPAEFLEVRLDYGEADSERTVALRPVGSRWSSRDGKLHQVVAAVEAEEPGRLAGRSR
ncbi:MAG: tRNA (adenosine(37)-N6)-threonylcarbamoyltransferase complex ATPase subunit type 1 TsaE [Actinomycetota bacterium]|jgi:tRNA threonylcarbamoyladenosine biosynthesis protein TsaE|nr:tRNA (adenosine(37)-N6)-threonylcarbamoyltransferase complex ATPase subunit type 1 TsaE [Actinomycetota bacterium]